MWKIFFAISRPTYFMVFITSSPGKDLILAEGGGRSSQYGEAMLELRARKKLQSLLGEDEK
jgi:hypothetical protein